MKPPESTLGKVGAALGLLALGAGAGAAAGAAVMPSGKNLGSTPAQAAGAVAGGVGGLALTSFGSLAALEFIDGEWGEVEGLAALIGGGLIAALTSYGVVSTLGQASSQLTPAPAPGGGALPGGTSYSEGVGDSGKTLNMKAGDTLTLTFPAPSGVGWSLAATSGLVTIQSQAVSAGEQTIVLAAGQGSGQIQATPPGGGAVFSINVNVVS